MSSKPTIDLSAVLYGSGLTTEFGKKAKAFYTVGILVKPCTIKISAWTVL